jgi:sugar O-acyltransferase (sialic acid O-acetyltransferase NeuD family)
MNLIIVGAGGLGREIYAWVMHDITNKPEIKILGFLDDNPNVLDKYSYPVGIINNLDNYQPKPDEKLIISIMHPPTKRNVVDKLKAKGAQFYTFIHPSVIKGLFIELGEGCVVCPNCILTNNIKLGDFVFVNVNSTVGHDSIVGDYTSINGKVEICASVNIGEECTFGVGAKIIPERKIGAGSTVGAGSIVIRNVPAGVTVFGNPAKKF